MDESRWMNSLLLDLYGALLTDKQRQCCELHFNEDLSLSEIAEQSGISRQGVWDNIRRAEAALQEMEEKTGLLRRITRTQQALEAVRAKLREIGALSEGQVKALAREAEQQIDALI